MKAIATVGPIGSGKDTAIKYISKKYGMPMISLGEIVADIARSEGLEPTRDNLHTITERCLKLHGSQFFLNKIFEKVETHCCKLVAIAGVRYPADVATLRKLFAKLMVLYVKTDKPEKRFERLKQRKEPRDPRNFEEFLIQDEQERKMFNLEETFKMADFVVENNGTLEELYQRIDPLIDRLF